MIKILLAGEGGQGVQTVAKIITEAAQARNEKTSFIPSFGVEQRGGVSLAYIQIAEENIPYPRFETADIIVAFCNRAIKAIENYITDQTIFIYDSSAISDDFLEPIKSKVKIHIGIPAQKIAKEKYSTKILNMILLGALAHQLKFNLEEVKSATHKTLGDKFKTEEVEKMNLDALAEGLTLSENFDSKSEFVGSGKPEIKLEFSDDKKTWTRFPEHCKGCGLCVFRCPVKAIQFKKEVGFLGNPLPEVDIEKCIACGMCQRTCPDGAIRLEKK